MRTALLLILLNLLSVGICYSAFAKNGEFVSLTGIQTTMGGNDKSETTQPRAVYSEDATAPSECEVAAAEAYLMAFMQAQKGYKIVNHSIKSVEKKVLNDVAYNYGYYEISGTQDGKNWAPQKMAYLILWKKISPERWKMYLDVWDYKETQQKELFLF